MVLGKLPVPGRPTIWITVGQGPTALAVGAGGGCLEIFTLIYPFSPISPSLWETARYRLKYCLKGPLNPKQPKNKFQVKESMNFCENGRLRLPWKLSNVKMRNFLFFGFVVKVSVNDHITKKPLFADAAVKFLLVYFANFITL